MTFVDELPKKRKKKKGEGEREILTRRRENKLSKNCRPVMSSLKSSFDILVLES